MIKYKAQKTKINNKSARLFNQIRLVCFLFILFSITLVIGFVSAQETSEIINEKVDSTMFPIGEKLTYNITFEKFKNAGYAEIHVISNGKLGDKNAVELRSKIKTDDFVSAVFYSIDETRKTFADAVTGLPLYIKKISNEGILSTETVENYMVQPTLDFDLLTLIYRVRNNGGVGSFNLIENGSSYNISFQNTVSEFVATPAGDFETGVSTVQSEYLLEKEIKKLKINFSLDEKRTPVLIRFETPKGKFHIELASSQIFNDEIVNVPTPTPTPSITPVRTPTPIPTPTPFLENQPLSQDLAFVLGETLEFRVKNLNQPIGTVVLQAKERKLYRTFDSLLLTATVTNVEPGNQVFKLNDFINAQVDPNTLSPTFIEIKFGGLLSTLNQTALFNQDRGTAVYNGTKQSEIPVGTHSLLSLFYAIRSFNLKPSPIPNNEVNDTRVAVFMDGVPYVFTLRPSKAEIINFREEKVAAQLVTIKTGNPNYDRMNLRLWLSTDEKRVPLRFAAGSYQADLISQKNILPKLTPIP